MEQQNNQELVNKMENNSSDEKSENRQQSTPNMTSPSNHTILAALSYIGPLVIVSYLMGKDNDFIKFHAGQGFVVFGIEVLVWILGSWMYPFWMILNILNLATLILSIIGIVNVVQGSKKELPVVGSLAKSFGL